MENKRFDNIGENLYTAKLPDGLTLNVAAKPGYATSFAAFAANYGGAMRRFSTGGGWVDTPAGVAHFLEHKMFDMPDGDNALNVLSANGADPNAYTSAGMTCYYFESTRDFYDNLEMLLRFVSTPYFTAESVKKEQGIIGQEISMTEDSPGFAVYINLMKLLYAAHPIRDAVAGTQQSIARITPEILYSCHKVFYNPSNMALCAAGDIDPEKVRDIALRVLPAEPGPVPKADFGPPEGELPLEKRSETAMELSAPQFLIGAKVPPAPGGDALLRQKLIGQLALRLLCGTSSDFYTRLYAQGLLTRDFDYEIDYAAGTATVVIGGESARPDQALAAFSDAVARAARDGLKKADFDRAVRASYGARLRGLEDFDSLCSALADGVFGGYCALDAFAMLQRVTPEDCAAYIRDYLGPDRLALSVITPKKE